MEKVPNARIDSVRAFNRAWTARIGALGASHLDTPYTLTEARVLYELAKRTAAPVSEIRRELDLDAGFLSRIMGNMRAEGLLKTGVSDADGRQKVARLTPKGRRAFAVLDERASEQVESLLSPLSEGDQRRLVGALGAVHGLLDRSLAPTPAFVLRPPRPGDLGWVVQAHGALYAEEYGWNERFEALVAAVVAEYANRGDPKRDAAWIAEVDGERAGSVFCIEKKVRGAAQTGARGGGFGGSPPIEKEAEVAMLRLLLVEAKFRGLGIGARLVEECIRFARRAGYRTMTLWTNDVLTSARRIYERAGFTLVEEEPHRRFGPELVGQTFSLTLA
jgi:DNA-binding MarR family transcriptional regulator/GNAT superfamily N-acetyltransferase